MQQYPFGHHPYEHGAYADSPPSMITAVSAAVLAAITGVLAAAATVFSVVVVVDVANDDHSSTGDLPDFGPLVAVIFLLIGAASALLALLYLLGALLLFLRKTTGRVFVIVASTLTAAAAFFFLAQDATISGIAALALPGATLVLAVLPATGRWIAHGKLPSHAP